MEALIFFRMIKMMLTVVIVYTVSWLPFNAIVVIGDLDPSIWAWEHMTYVFPIIQWLALAHTVCNPIIYCWMNSRFRSGFRSAIENVPFWRRIPFLGQSGQRDFSPSHRLQTYTFQSGGNGQGKLIRNSSLISTGGRTTTVNLSPSAVRHYPKVMSKGHCVADNGPFGNQFDSIPLQVLGSANQSATAPSPLQETLVVTRPAPSTGKSRPRKPSRHDSLLESFL